MRARISRWASILIKPIGFTIVLMIFAGGFAWLQLEAEAVDLQCNQLTDQISDFENQVRFDELGVQLTNIDIQLDRMEMSLGEDSEEGSAPSREIERLRRVNSMSEDVQSLNRQLVRARIEAGTACAAVPWLLHITAASALIMTLAAGAFGFWAGTRRSQI